MKVERGETLSLPERKHTFMKRWMTKTLLGVLALLLIAGVAVSVATHSSHAAHAAGTSYCKRAILEYHKRVGARVEPGFFQVTPARTYVFDITTLQVDELFCYNGSAITEDNGPQTANVKAFPGPLWVGNHDIDLSYQPSETLVKESYTNSQDGNNTPKGIRFVQVSAHFTGIKAIKVKWLSDLEVGVPDWRPSLTLRLRGDGSFDYSPSSGDGVDTVTARATDCTDPAFNPTTCRPRPSTKSISKIASTNKPLTVIDGSTDWCAADDIINVNQGYDPFQFRKRAQSKPDANGEYAVLYALFEEQWTTGKYDLPGGVLAQNCPQSPNPTPPPTPPVPPTPPPTPPTPIPADVDGSWYGSLGVHDNTFPGGPYLSLDMQASSGTVSGTGQMTIDGTIGQSPHYTPLTLSGTFDGTTMVLTTHQTNDGSRTSCDSTYTLSFSQTGTTKSPVLNLVGVGKSPCLSGTDVNISLHK